jgi:hypothetical protein
MSTGLDEDLDDAAKQAVRKWLNRSGAVAIFAIAISQSKRTDFESEALDARRTRDAKAGRA